MKNTTMWAVAVLMLGAYISPSHAQYGAPPIYPSSPTAGKSCGCNSTPTSHHGSGLFGGFFHRIKTRWFGNDHNHNQPIPYNNATVSTVPGQPIVIDQPGAINSGLGAPGTVIYPPLSETTPPPIETVPVITNP